MALPAASAVLAGFLSFPAAGPVLPPDKLFVPSRHAERAPLVVVLHGCEQDADAIAASTGWNRLAEREGFFVLYPNQQYGRNPYNCWNWFLPVNQAAGLGEPAEIAAAIGAVELLEPVDPARVYVAGLSAGGAEAATMLACYPALFAGGGIHSGVPYGVATDAGAALAVMKDGPGDRGRASFCAPARFRGRVFVIHGSSDTAVNPANAQRLAADFSGGAPRDRATTPATAARDGWTTVDWSGPGAAVREVVVDGLGHAWSGGAAGTFGDPRGPDAASLMWDYFSSGARAAAARPAPLR